MNIQAHHPLAELLARKLSGIESVPPAVQTRMVNRAIRAAVEWHETHKAGQTDGGRGRHQPKGEHEAMAKGDDTDLYRIEAPYFVAGFEATAAGKILRPAPILRRWITGRTLADALAYCRRHGWKVERIG